MRVVAYDPFVGAERYRELGVEKADVAPTRSTPRPTSSRCTCPRRPRPRAGSTPRRSRSARTACGSSTSPAARSSSTRTCRRRSTRGKVAGAALDVFRSEPVTEHPLFGYPNVIVTPHLGASTAEATDRAGYQAAEQVVAALTGGASRPRSTCPAVAAEDLEVLGPFLPLCRRARPDRHRRSPRARRSTASRSSCLGRIAERDTRPLAIAVLLGVLSGHTEEDVNAVNAPSIAAGARASSSSRPSAAAARDFTDLVRVTVVCGRPPRARRRHDARPAATARTCSRPGASASTSSSRTTSRCSATATCPGMIGRVGTAFGEHGINIVSAAVGHVPEGDGDGGEARHGRHHRRAGPAGRRRRARRDGRLPRRARA